MQRIVERLDSVSADAAHLGGKGASLARLVRLGYRVPPGLVVTPEAFRVTCERLGLAGDVDAVSRGLARGEAVDDAARAVRDGLAAGRVPEEVLEAIVREVARLRLWGDAGDAAAAAPAPADLPARLIVRSSATVEDGSSHSFAGVFESVPIDRPDALEPTVRDIWRSVFAPRAVAYFAQVGLDAVPGMAVVVQRFLSAARSGVMFTRFSGPAGRQQVLVEHVEGDCEKLVRGEITPDRLWLDGPDDVPDAPEGPLAATHARELARLAQTLERDFGAPQDVEWVVADGRVHVVQSRPITAGLGGAGAEGAPLAGAGTSGTGAVPPSDEEHVLLRGIAASPGVGAGAVHLAFNIEDALRLETGRVLVTPMTNPDMVVAMRNSAGIVTDVGGVICHAAIVSRELGLPCIVGTGAATTTLAAGETVTVDGWNGTVSRGDRMHAAPDAPLPPCEWTHLWERWREAHGGRSDVVPAVGSADALESAPDDVRRVVLVPDVDLRADPGGLWRDLEGMTESERRAALDGWAARVAEIARERALGKVWVLPRGPLPREELAAAVRGAGAGVVVMHGDDADAPEPDERAAAEPRAAGRRRPVAVPLSCPAPPADSSLSGMDAAERVALDTIRFFGHQPNSRPAGMPDPAARRAWWELLPDYGRFHRESATERETGEHRWLEIRPELVISAMLKSLVQPGFEMIPRVLGFEGAPPMHVKWIRCRYHFRDDTFDLTWKAIVRLTWDRTALADLMRRVRASYVRLGEASARFPTADAELRALPPASIRTLVTDWWPHWVEFFALNWFIQAQGDDVLFPFLDETARDGLARIGPPPAGTRWPTSPDLIAPTCPVMSGEYMASVGALREALLAAGLGDRAAAEAALDRGEHPEIAARIARHLERWHWMRDRDLLFEPWDTRGRVIGTALKTDPHAATPYAANRRRNVLAIAFHADLARASGREEGVRHAGRFLHDLNVERENHHVLWLKNSYPLRQLLLEVERRWVEAGSLAPGDVFFLQMPELLAATGGLPGSLSEELAGKAKNRRRGYLREAGLPPVDAVEPVAEDDYL